MIHKLGISITYHIVIELVQFLEYICLSKSQQFIIRTFLNDYKSNTPYIYYFFMYSMRSTPKKLYIFLFENRYSKAI